MNGLFLLLLLCFSNNIFAFSSNFPLGPNPELTPGKLCDLPKTYRYPEHIAYCERNVSLVTKLALIEDYDQKLGFKIKTLNRSDFKVDHYIPLCAGGSNDSSNLWPQHKSIYQITDPIEPLLCNKMIEGKLSQQDAVKLIIRAKLNLNEVHNVMAIINAL